MLNELYKMVDKLDGYVFGIGINDDNLVYKLSNNKSITTCFLFNLKSSINNNDESDKSDFISIHDLRKKFKKEKAKYIICDINDVVEHLNLYINDSIYMSNNKIYCYTNNDIIDSAILQKLYKIYSSNIEVKKYKDGYILIVDVTKSKSSHFKNIIVKIVILFYQIVDGISNILNT